MKQIVLFFAVFTLNASLYSQLPKGDRTFAWQVDNAENDDFLLALGFAQEACMESIHLAIDWSNLETDSGVYDPEFVNLLDIADYLFPLYSTEMELQLSVTNTVVKTVPDDLMVIDFDDPELISRFKIALDTVLTHLSTVELSALNIGNESDVLFGNDPVQYAKFKTFLDEVRVYAKLKYLELYDKELNVGTTLTLYGMTDPIKSPLCQSLNENMDIIAVTYYPLNPDFSMKSPYAIEPDFDHLVAIYNDPTKPIYFVECGYSSSAVCSSSEILQAQFFSEVFRVWDKYYDNIKYLSVFKTTDWSFDQITFLSEYYGIDDPLFLEFLRTLGVRTWNGDGTNKLAYEFIKCELEARDWCSTSCSLTEIAQQKNDVELAIAPNPFANRFTIQSNQPLAYVKLFSVTGELVYESLTGSNRIDTSHLPDGIYLVEVQTTTNEIWREKIVKSAN